MTPAPPEVWGVARYGNPCAECGWSWPAAEEAVEFVEGVADEFAHALAGRDGGTRHPDHGWTVAGYVAHVGDNLRQWAERLVEAVAGQERLVDAYDPDALGRARGYDRIGAAGALWSLRAARPRGARCSATRCSTTSSCSTPPAASSVPPTSPATTPTTPSTTCTTSAARSA